jgi:hypothetical protein
MCSTTITMIMITMIMFTAKVAAAGTCPLLPKLILSAADMQWLAWFWPLDYALAVVQFWC